MDTRAAEPATRHLVCVIGAAGGDGSTTIAVNLAVCLQAMDSARSVLLMDMDVRGGDVLPFVGLESPHSLREMANGPARVDEVYLMNLLVRHPSGLYVLPSGYDGWMSEAPAVVCLQQVATLVQSLFELVVVDCGDVIEPATTVLLDRATVVVVVSSLRPRSVRRARRVFAWFREHGLSPGRIRLVVNRFDRRQAAVLREAESLLGCQATVVIPDEPEQADEAIEEGVPAVTLFPGTALSAAISQLATLCVARRGSQPKADRVTDRLGFLRRRLFAGQRDGT